MAIHTELAIRQASHSQKDRAELARTLLRKEFSVDAALTKNFPPRRKP